MTFTVANLLFNTFTAIMKEKIISIDLSRFGILAFCLHKYPSSKHIETKVIVNFGHLPRITY